MGWLKGEQGYVGVGELKGNRNRRVVVERGTGIRGKESINNLYIKSYL